MYKILGSQRLKAGCGTDMAGNKLVVVESDSLQAHNNTIWTTALDLRTLMNA